MFFKVSHLTYWHKFKPAAQVNWCKDTLKQEPSGDVIIRMCRAINTVWKIVIDYNQY